MSHSASASVRRLPALLVLGLLALLLWGQCGQLFQGSTREPGGVVGWVKSVDSLSTTPATLYLTLYLRNNLSQPVQVREASGTLRYGGRLHQFATPPSLRDTLLYPWTELTHPVAIPFHLSADSLALLRTLLDIGYPADAAPSLRWQASYSPRQSPAVRRQARITPYLPLLTPGR